LKSAIAAGNYPVNPLILLGFQGFVGCSERSIQLQYRLLFPAPKIAKNALSLGLESKQKAASLESLIRRHQRRTDSRILRTIQLLTAMPEAGRIVLERPTGWKPPLNAIT
jgi:hypothetical protein